jgi:hypothetical protein
VFAVTKDPEVLKIIRPCFGLSSDIELQTHANIEEAIDLATKRIEDGLGLLELFVMDLDLGIPVKNIKELNKSTSKILGLATSSEHELNEEIKILSKPLSYIQVIDEVMFWANLGRSYSAVSHDELRPRRVFLSFCSEDERKGNELRDSLVKNRIQPSYSPTRTQAGKVDRNELENWLAKAEVFVALISNAYLQSDLRKSELISFWRRLEDTRSDKLIPVYYKLPDQNDQFLKEFVEGPRPRYHMSASDVLDNSSLSAELVKHINRILGQ